jgi:hypothetical protein
MAELPPDQWGYRAIGTLQEVPGASVIAADATVMDFSHSGWDHFRA